MADLFSSLESAINAVPELPLAPTGYYIPDIETRVVRTAYELAIETGQDSVRINIAFKKHDGIEELICNLFAGFIQKRADDLHVFRRISPQDASGRAVADLSILITRKTASEFDVTRIIKFTCSFLDSFERERSFMKIYINSKARSVAGNLLDEIK